ncbi:MAG: PDZ domain-containing protein [Anaerolineae bacterium]|jgi:membrane-associated protease RseP (regulator of RpoE activity)
MEEEKRKLYNLMAIVAVVVLLFSCVAGALAGGFAGFLVGRHQARLAAERLLAGTEDFWFQFPHMPEPWEEIPPGDDLQPGDVTGAAIVEVMPGTPAERAGLRVGDIIFAIDRTPIDQIHPLDQVIAQYEPNDRITLRFQRREEERSVRVILGAHPDRSGRPYLGVRFEMMTTPRFDLPGS